MVLGGQIDQVWERVRVIIEAWCWLRRGNSSGWDLKWQQ